MKHTSLVWFVFSSLAISAFTTEMQTTSCLGREMKPPAHAGCMSARPGSQNPSAKTGTSVCASENLNIPVNVSLFCRTLYRCFLLWHLITAPPSFWDFPGLSNKNNNNKPNEPSKERVWTFSWRRQYGYSWILPASCPLSQKWTLLPSAPQRHTKVAYDVTAANRIHLPGWLCFLMKGPVSELMVGQERGPADSSKILLYGFLSTRKAVGSVWSGSIWGFSYMTKVHHFTWFISYNSV